MGNLNSYIKPVVDDSATIFEDDDAEDDDGNTLTFPDARFDDDATESFVLSNCC